MHVTKILFNLMDILHSKDFLAHDALVYTAFDYHQFTFTVATYSFWFYERLKIAKTVEKLVIQLILW